MKLLDYRACLLFALCANPGFCLAATQNVAANIAFETPLTVVKNSDVNFGYVKALQTGTYSISTAGVVSSSNGGLVLGGSQTAANISIAGSDAQLIEIAVANYTANGGVMPSNATCAYNGGPAAACHLTAQAAPGNGKTLLIGLDVAVDGTQTLGSAAAPTFDVVINYN